MTYTKEFEEWVGEDSSNKVYAHHWLSAFARLVREEAAKEAQSWQPGHDANCVDVETAFNTICERFGLKGK